MATRQNRDIVQTLAKDIKNLINTARLKAIKSVEFQRVQIYWSIGYKILEEEQNGELRAEYGKQIIKDLSLELEPIFGSGYSVRQLELMRQFYKVFSNANALHSQLNWTQYKLLIRIDSEDKREFYINESIKNCWSARQLERQTN